MDFNRETKTDAPRRNAAEVSVSAESKGAGATPEQSGHSGGAVCQERRLPETETPALSQSPDSAGEKCPARAADRKPPAEAAGDPGRDGGAALLLREAAVRSAEAAAEVLRNIKEVEKIANQTNLLAINASVETIHASQLLSSFETIISDHLLIQARMLAVILRFDPDFLCRPGDRFARECGIEELFVTDENGTVVFSSMKDRAPVSLSSEPVLKILKNPDLEVILATAGTPGGAALFKSVAASRRDGSGIIQIGASFQRPGGKPAIDGFGIVAREAKQLADDSRQVSAGIVSLTEELNRSLALLRAQTEKRETQPDFSAAEPAETFPGQIPDTLLNLLRKITLHLHRLNRISRQTSLLGVRAAIEAAHSANTKRDFDTLLNRHMITEARMAALMIERIPGLTSPVLKDLAGEIGLNELWITDETGAVELTTMLEGQDFVFTREGQTAPYMKILEAPGLVVKEPPAVRALDGKVFKYVGIGRKDKPGILQIGLASRLYGESTAEGFSSVAGQIKILAEQSRSLTSEIESRIAFLTRQVREMASLSARARE